VNNQKIDIFLDQKRALQRASQLSNTPYYIQSLERNIERVEYKLDLLIEKLDKIIEAN